MFSTRPLTSSLFLGTSILRCRHKITHLSTVKLSTKPVFAYWDIRGLAHHNRLILNYLKVDYEDKQYTFGPPPDYSHDSWFNEKFSYGLDFPNLPYFIDDNIRLSESKAIYKYIARTRAPHLVPTSPKLLAYADMVESLAHDLYKTLATLAYSTTGIPIDPLEIALAPKFQQLDAFLIKRTWVLGSNLSYVDFFLYETLKQYKKFNPNFFKPYLALTLYIENFETLPQLKEYVKSTENLLCNSPNAKLQF